MSGSGWLKDVGPWAPTIAAVAADVGLPAAAVYGRVAAFCQMRDGVCRASLGRIGEELGLHTNTVRRCMRLLCRRGYLRDLTPERRHAPHVHIDTGKVLIYGLLEAQRGARRSTTEVPEVYHSGRPGLPQRCPRSTTVVGKDTMRTRMNTPPPDTMREDELAGAEDGGGGHTHALGVLVSFGVNPPVAQELATRRSLDDIEGWIAYAKTAKGLRNPVGLVVARLKAGEPAPGLSSASEPDSCRGMPLYE